MTLPKNLCPRTRPVEISGRVYPVPTRMSWVAKKRYWVVSWMSEGKKFQQNFNPRDHNDWVEIAYIHAIAKLRTTPYASAARYETMPMRLRPRPQPTPERLAELHQAQTDALIDMYRRIEGFIATLPVSVSLSQ